MIDYDLVNSFVGKKWVYLENDCYAVVKQASKQVFGIEIIDNISFATNPEKGDTAKITNIQTKKSCWEKTFSPKGGDIIVFSDQKNNPVHIGIFIEGDNILHCMGGHGVKNGRTRYDPLSVVRLLYRNYEAYKYVNNSRC